MPPSLRSDRVMGDYRLVREIGRGGMGVVFEAIQESLGRRVALKILPSHISMNEGALQRFRREATTAGRLNHPGIAQVYGVGQDQDLHYFAMELVDGPSLENCLKEVRGKAPEELTATLVEAGGHPPPEWVPPSPQSPYFASIAAWAARIADALSAAHRERVLHRDLKPSNILIRPDGSPVLVDFGLSQDGSDCGLTKTGDAVGTPAYMAPEQARGEKDLDERVDVYGLGATLYELVTLRPPFEGKHPTQVMQRILEEDVIDPRKLNPACPPDLENVILRCVAKERDQRYRDTRDLARDLRSFLRGEPVEARAPTTLDRLRRALRRRRRSIVASVVTATTLIIAGSGLVWFKGGFEKQAAEQRFLRALDELGAGRDTEAFQSFLRAREVLGDEGIKTRWLEWLRRRVENLQKDGRHDQALDALLPTAKMYADDPRVREWTEEVRGRGTIELRMAPPDARVTMQHIDEEGQLDPEVRVFVPGRRVARGLWLLRAEAPGHEPGLRIVEVVRDQTVRIVLRALPGIDRLPDTVYVAGDEQVPPFLIDRHEVTNRQYAEFLSAIPDVDQRRSLLPKDGWNDDGPPADKLDHPVRWVPLHAASSYARFRGGHIPSFDEFRLAGNLGGPWAYPWGPDFDPERIVADPLGLTGPVAVGQRPQGASLSGCLDLLGNLAEWVHGSDGRALAAGGGYESHPESLRLDRGRRMDGARAYREVGFRLAYYVTPPSSEAGAGRTDEIWRRQVESGLPVVRSTIRVEEHGGVSVDLEVAGSVVNLERPPLSFQLPGGRAHFEPLRSEVTGGQEIGLVPRAPGIRDQVFLADAERLVRHDGGKFHLQVRHQVMPKQVLIPLGGGRYLHRFLLLRRAGEAQLHRLILPGRSRIHRATPEPSERRVDAGEQLLTMHLPARVGGRPELVPVEVEFSMDVRDEPLPPDGQVTDLLRAFTSLWNSRDTEGLRELTQESFTFGAGAMRRGELFQLFRRATEERDPAFRLAAQEAHLQLPDDPVIRSISGFGRQVRAEVDAGAAGSWVFTLLRTRSGLRVLELGKPVTLDRTLVSSDQLANRDVAFRMPIPEGWELNRLDRFSVPLQLRFDKSRRTVVVPQDGDDVEHEVLFSVLVLGGELAVGQTVDELVDTLERNAFPFWAQLSLPEPASASFGTEPNVPARMLWLYRPWLDDQREYGLMQKRVTWQRGKTVFFVVATASSATGKYPVLVAAWQRMFHGALDELLGTIRTSSR